MTCYTEKLQTPTNLLNFRNAYYSRKILQNRFIYLSVEAIEDMVHLNITDSDMVEFTIELITA